MNIFNKGLLKLFLLPSGFYTKIGVDIAQLKSILNTKLIMDDRRMNPVAQSRRRKKDKPVSRATIGTMLVSLLMGLLFLFAFSFGSSILTQLTFYYTLMFFMLSMTLIADFTSVLIDVRDNFIILPKPVNDRTFVVARLLHIFIHILKIVVPMSLPGIVYMMINYGAWGMVGFFIIDIMVTGFAIFFINAVYIIILKITSPQRFQSIISYFQVVFAIVMYGSYQLFPRMADRLNLYQLDITKKSWIVYYPIYWFVNCWKVFYRMQGNLQEAILATLGLLTPLISIFIVVRYLAPSFNNNLALINTSGSTPEAGEFKKKKTQSFSFSGWLSKIFTSSQAEKMGFQFVWKMSSRSRDFKLKVYPSMGYMLVYVVIMFFNSKKLSLDDFADNSLKAKVLIISALYITSLLLITALGQIIYSDKYKASWIYYTSPLNKPGEVIAGGAKAAILKFYIPIVVVITIAGLLVAGPKILPNIVLGLVNEVLIACILMYVTNKLFPFSMHQSNSQKAGSIFKSFMVVAISSLIAFGHFLIYSILPALIICVFLSAVASWFMMDSIKRISWETIKNSYTED